MDLDALKELLRVATKARESGISQKDIEAEIWRRTEGSVNTISGLRRMIAGMEKPYDSGSGFGRALAEGATFSFADELVGLAHGLVPGGKGYTEARDESRGRYDAYRRAHPVAALAGEVLGGAVVPIGGAAAGASRAGATLGARVLGGMAGGAIAGAGAGALTGAGMAETLQDTPGATIMGGAAGGVGGAALGAGVPLLGAVARPLMQRAGALVAPEATARWMSRDALRRAMADAGIEGADELARRAAALPDGSVLADLDPSLSRQARAMVNRSPALEREGGAYAQLGRRQAARGERIAADLRSTTGVTQSVEEGIRDLNEEIARIRREGYDVIEAAYPNGLVSDRVARTIADDPDLLKFAQEVLPGYGERRPSFREMQDLLIDVRAEADRFDQLPGKGRRLRAAYDKLRLAMEESIPGFAEVQADMAATFERAGAYELGVKRGWDLTSRQIREHMGTLTEQGRDAFRVGMLDKLETELRKVEGGGAAAEKLMRAAPEIFDRILPLFPSEEAAQEFLQRMGRERRWALTWRALSGNSSTAKQMTDVMPLNLQSILAEMVDVGPVQTRAAEMAGNILMSPPTPPGVRAPMLPGMPGPTNPFLQLLQIGSSPVATGGAGGAAAARM